MRSVERAGLTCLLALVVAAAPASAQVLISGDWVGLFHEDQPERAPGPEVGDYLGLPINAAARQYADSWDASRLTLPEHQCRAHAVPYINRGPIRLRIWEEKDPLTQATTAMRIFLSTYAQDRTIYLDGRPHPPEYAPHTWQGFSTGAWNGSVLTVTTTHIKRGWHRRNGLPQSEQTVLTEHFYRHGNYLTHVTITDDPVFLEEPLVKTTNHILDLNTQPANYQGWLVCQADDEVPGRDPAWVPHHLPGQNPFIADFAKRHGLPFEATRGGAATMYPEYLKKVVGATR
ncbi:MAG: hypothetical protein HY657_06465 [Acidobacteria bacterium]|nr:hypothetical protein [Acidobacteriota bacterium]